MGVTDCFYVQELLLYCQNCKIIMRYFIKCDNWTELLQEWENLAHCQIWALCTVCEQKEIFPANCYERILMCLRERAQELLCLGLLDLYFLGEWKSWSLWDTDGLIARVQLVLWKAAVALLSLHPMESQQSRWGGRSVSVYIQSHLSSTREN